MKHLTAVVLALCLMGVCVPKAGRAEDYVTLSQLREQLPATWESRRMGQAEGVLKAPIILPAADKLPAMTMLPRQDVSNETFQDSWGAEAPDFYLNVGQGNIRRVSRKLYLTDNDYATLQAENTLTADEAVKAVLEAASAAWGIQVQLRGVRANSRLYEQLQNPRTYETYKGKASSEKGYYEVALEQTVSGVPLLSFYCAPLGSAEHFPTPMLEAEIYDEANYEIYGWLYQAEGEPLAEDLPLASWPVIEQSLRRALSAGRLKEVYGIRLGYVLLMDSQRPGRCVTVPAWGIAGMPDWLADQIKNERWDEQDIESYRQSQWANIHGAALYINAQTGAWIENPDITGETCDADLLTWEAAATATAP